MRETILNRLILKLYEAGMTSELWTEMLGDLRDVSRSNFVSLYMQSRNNGLIDLMADTGMEPEWERTYRVHYAEQNPF